VRRDELRREFRRGLAPLLESAWQRALLEASSGSEELAAASLRLSQDVVAQQLVLRAALGISPRARGSAQREAAEIIGAYLRDGGLPAEPEALAEDLVAAVRSGLESAAERGMSRGIGVAAALRATLERQEVVDAIVAEMRALRDADRARLRREAIEFWRERYPGCLAAEQNRVSYLGIALGAHRARAETEAAGFTILALYQEPWARPIAPGGTQEAGAGQEDGEPMGAGSLLALEGRCALVGEPGVGKSAFASWVAVRTAEQESDPVPVLVELGRYREPKGGEAALLLREAARQAMETEGLQNLSLSVDDAARALARLMAQGRVRLLLDGLDEILDGGWRGRVVRQVWSLARTFPLASLYVTCRPLSYEGRLSTREEPLFAEFQLERLSEDQVREYAAGWLRVKEPGISDGDAAERASAFMAASSHLKELRGVPLILQLLCALWHMYGRRLPDTESAVYQAIVDTFAEQWDEYRHELPRSREFPVKPALQHLALWMTERDTREPAARAEAQAVLQVFLVERAGASLAAAQTDAGRLLDFVSERVWVFTVRRRDQLGREYYDFVHNLLREHLAAAGMAERAMVAGGLPCLVQEIAQMLSEVLSRPEADPTREPQRRWDKVLLLLGPLLQEQARLAGVVSKLLRMPGATAWQTALWTLALSASGVPVGQEALRGCMEALVATPDDPQAESYEVFPAGGALDRLHPTEIAGRAVCALPPALGEILPAVLRDMWPKLCARERWHAAAATWELVFRGVVGRGGLSAYLLSGGWDRVTFFVNEETLRASSGLLQEVVRLGLPGDPPHPAAGVLLMDVPMRIPVGALVRGLSQPCGFPVADAIGRGLPLWYGARFGLVEAEQEGGDGEQEDLEEFRLQLARRSEAASGKSALLCKLYQSGIYFQSWASLMERTWRWVEGKRARWLASPVECRGEAEPHLLFATGLARHWMFPWVVAARAREGEGGIVSDDAEADRWWERQARDLVLGRRPWDPRLPEGAFGLPSDAADALQRLLSEVAVTINAEGSDRRPG